MDLAPPLCSRTHHCHPKIATIQFRVRWASLSGRLHMIHLKEEAGYPIITPALNLDPLRLPPPHQMAMNLMTATQSKKHGRVNVCTGRSLKRFIINLTGTSAWSKASANHKDIQHSHFVQTILAVVELILTA